MKFAHHRTRVAQLLLAPSACSPPHGLTHPEKLEQLIAAFESTGWDDTKPHLLGYWWKGSVQLVSGSHRWLAAKYADIPIPVDVYPYSFMQSIWGTDEWVKLIARYTL